jgi:hypothetical protein
MEGFRKKNTSLAPETLEATIGSIGLMGSMTIRKVNLLPLNFNFVAHELRNNYFSCSSMQVSC